MGRAIGKIIEIHRYPVKSLAGERLDACRIERYGLYGDRFGAFYDPDLSGWDSYLTARECPAMLSYQARLTADGGVQVAAPDGRTFGWEATLLEEIRSRSGKPISMTSWRAPHMENPELMAVDLYSVLIIPDAVLKRLGSHWGKALDSRRLRPNIIVSVEDQDMEEADWVGKRLTMGDAIVQAERQCVRCAIPTLDPDTQVRDPSLLKAINKKMDTQVGVYASVVRPGGIRIGDEVRLEE